MEGAAGDLCSGSLLPLTCSLSQAKSLPRTLPPFPLPAFVCLVS